MKKYFVWLRPNDKKMVLAAAIFFAYVAAFYRALGAFGGVASQLDHVVLLMFYPWATLTGWILNIFGAENGYIFTLVLILVFLVALASMYVIPAALVALVEWLWSKFKKV